MKIRLSTREVTLAVCALALGFGLGSFRTGGPAGAIDRAGAENKGSLAVSERESPSKESRETKSSSRQNRLESANRDPDGAILTLPAAAMQRMEFELINLNGMLIDIPGNHGNGFSWANEWNLREFGLNDNQIALFKDLTKEVMEIYQQDEAKRSAKFVDDFGNGIVKIEPGPRMVELEELVENRLRVIGGSRGDALVAAAKKEFAALTSDFGEAVVFLHATEDNVEFAALKKSHLEIGLSGYSGDLRKLIAEFPLARRGRGSRSLIDARFGEILK